MNITILGCGVFGQALANCFLDHEHIHLKMWNKFQEEIDKLESRFPSISFSTDLRDSIRGSDLIVIAIPVAFLEEVIINLQKVYQNQDILVASKGIDTVNFKFAYEIILKHLGNVSIGVLSGGTFAQDMTNKKVMGLTLGTNNDRIKEKVQNSLESDYLRIQYNHDLMGVSICGAIKNVMAIGSGILDGAGYPESTRFLFLTEAIYEVRTVIRQLGGDIDTIMSYAGLDDIMMTCTSSKSRNYTLGKLIGSGTDSKVIDAYKRNTTIEGLGTSKAIYYLGKSKELFIPISNLIYEILYENRNYQDLVHYLERKES